MVLGVLHRVLGVLYMVLGVLHRDGTMKPRAHEGVLVNDDRPPLPPEEHYCSPLKNRPGGGGGLWAALPMLCMVAQHGWVGRHFRVGCEATFLL